MNPYKGEVAFEADGQTYTICLSFDALCVLEEAAGKGIIAISNELSDPERISMTMVRLITWAGLRMYHPEVDLKATGELIQKAGGLVPMIGIIGKALERTFPEMESGGVSSPPKAGQNGTGPRSTAHGAA